MKPTSIDSNGVFFPTSATKDGIALRQLPIAELFGWAERLKADGQAPIAAELYKAWIALNGDHDLLYAVYFNFGVALSDLDDRLGAINAFRDSIRLKPDFMPPSVNLGRALEDVGQAGSALSEWLNAAAKLAAVNGESVKQKTTLLTQAGRLLETLQKDAAAEDSLKQVIELSSWSPEAIQHWIALRQRQCKWPTIEASQYVSREKLLSGISPLSQANLSDDPMFLLASAYRYGKTSIGVPRIDPRKRVKDARATAPRGKIRIGYVSSDLRAHAVGFGMTEVMELHDRSQFEIFAYYCGIERVDGTKQRIQAAVDKWVDINALTDEQAAAQIVADKIDILIDLNGYTKSARSRVFSLRPAPIIVNWFGYPGTMGTPYHHYLIADPIIVPEDSEVYYSEKVLRLPCYQPNDRKRTVSPRAPSRKDMGLPEDAMVYCSFNGAQKLTARIFNLWMTILKNAANSVLWLLGATDDTNERLRSCAENAGVGRERMLFAEKLANPDHLARYPLADLFLDSFPYGAHTTGADSLWMGVPVLTLQGRSFASRVCSSLLHAAGLEQLVCSTEAEYVSKAVAYANDRNRLLALKKHLRDGRDSCLLFDTARLVGELEALFRQMLRDLGDDNLPRPDLSNLDTYHDIAVGLDYEMIDAMSDADYRTLYREQLSRRHATYPIAADARLWRGGADPA
ncbi:MAG: glycosyl transferase [Roseiarcus sp.]